MKHLFKEKVNYTNLIGKEQEVYNYAKTASTLVEYGYVCNLITADKHGADMIAYNFLNGENIQIQLKGSRATLDKKYIGKNLYIAYTDRNTNEICIYDHDLGIEIFENTKSALTNTWKKTGMWSSQTLDKLLKEITTRLPIK
jgi:hypothetical protein